MDVSKIGNPLPAKSESASSSSVQDKKTVADYRKLYSYLLKKLDRINSKTTKFDVESERINFLTKFLQERNDVIIDLLKYMDQNEELNPISFLLRSKEESSLSRVIETKKDLATILQPLLSLAEADDEEKLSTIQDALKLLKSDEDRRQQLFMKENSILPDMYDDKDYRKIFKGVKKNKFYVHTTTGYTKNPSLDSGLEYLKEQPAHINVENVILKFTGENRHKFETIVGKDEGGDDDDDVDDSNGTPNPGESSPAPESSSPVKREEDDVNTL